MILIEKKNTRLKSALVGQNELINSFGIMTPENPMGVKSSKEDNAQVRSEFEADLKKLRYDYIPIIGSYGNIEKSYFIININIDDLDYLGHAYNQESFIYAEKNWSKDYEKSAMTFSYYQKGKKDSPYKELDVHDKITTDSEAKDFFTSLKSYKFNIPFSIFEKYIPEASSLLREKYSHIPIEQLLSGIIKNIKEKNTTVKHRWTARSLLFESQESKINRYERLLEASKNNPSKAKYLPDEVLEYEKNRL